MIKAQDSNYLFIAYHDKNAVGYAWAAIEEKPDFVLKYGRRQVYIHQIAVDENYRKQHVGKALFQEIESVAAQKKISHIEIDTWAFNKEAQAFFNKMGFEAYNIKLWRKPAETT